MKIRLLSFILFLTVGLLTEPVTWGFSLSRYRLIPTSIPSAGTFPAALHHKTWKLVDQGGQSYVFVSGSHVLKFFKDEPRPWLLWPSYQRLKTKKLHRTLNGYSLIFSRCPHRSGLLNIHTEKSAPIPATLVDRLGSPHTIDLSDYIFVLQHKASPLTQNSPHLQEQALALVQELASHHLTDHDPRLHSNLGVLGNELIVLDPGRIVDDPHPPSTLPEKFLEHFQ